MSMKPVSEAATRLADVIERELNGTRANERYADVKTKVRRILKPVDIRCLAIICAEVVMEGGKHVKVTCKRKKPKHRVTRRGHREHFDPEPEKVDQ